MWCKNMATSTSSPQLRCCLAVYTLNNTGQERNIAPQRVVNSKNTNFKNIFLQFLRCLFMCKGNKSTLFPVKFTENKLDFSF